MFGNTLFLENYEQAISDFNDCLKIQEVELEPDDRLLAETYPFTMQWSRYSEMMKGIADPNVC